MSLEIYVAGLGLLALVLTIIPVIWVFQGKDIKQMPLGKVVLAVMFLGFVWWTAYGLS